MNLGRKIERSSNQFHAKIARQERKRIAVFDRDFPHQTIDTTHINNPHVILRQASPKTEEWLSEFVGEGMYDRLGVALIGFRNQDDAFAFKMRWL